MRVISFPRVHIALADLAGATFRRFGGAGISIDGLPTIVDVERVSRHPQVMIPPTSGESTLRVIHALLDRLRPECGDLSVTVAKAPPEHIGLGSKTSLVMAVLVGAFGAAQVDRTRDELQNLSRRGGASGVGIHTFFDGGFIADGGHRQELGTSDFLPSSASLGHRPPPKLVQLSVPSSWHFTLILPRGHTYSGQDEVAFFRQHTPISEQSALRVLGLLYHGVSAAVATDDFALFREALAELQRCGFKRREIAGQPRIIRLVLRRLREQSIAAGMSSMGPLVYAVSPDAEAAEIAKATATELGAAVLGTFRARNTGYERHE